MTVDIERATADGRVSEHNGMTWYFCGKGCQLEFHDDPDKYFDPNYTPSM
jgi:YHS domain-containing protein